MRPTRPSSCCTPTQGLFGLAGSVVRTAYSLPPYAVQSRPSSPADGTKYRRSGGRAACRKLASHRGIEPHTGTAGHRSPCIGPCTPPCGGTLASTRIAQPPSRAYPYLDHSLPKCIIRSLELQTGQFPGTLSTQLMLSKTNPKLAAPTGFEPASDG